MKQLFLILFLTALLFSCNSKKTNNQDSENQIVTVSILPQKTFVEKIGGNDFTVNVLIPPGASPATYTLLPSQLKNIARSEIWFRIGYIGFEHSWKDKIEQTNKNMKVVNLSEELDLIAGSVVQHGDHVHIDGVDPHTWLSPPMVKQMAKRIMEELLGLRPENSEQYKSNYTQFANEIDQLDNAIREKLKNHEGKEIITFHPSLSYFAREYGLVQHSLEVDGKEPTPKHMSEVVKMAKEKSIDVIYIQSEFDRDHARVFAEEVSGEIVEVTPLAPNWAENLIELTNTLSGNL